MQKQKENLFSTKFRMLNSQEISEEIHWSSSELSDFENVSNNGRFCNLSNKQQTRKRKRKKKVSKNMFNLDFATVDVTKDLSALPSVNKSPILDKEIVEKCRSISPVLVTASKYFPPYKCGELQSSSPILPSKANCKLPPKSPILLSKHGLPKSPILVSKHGLPKSPILVSKHGLPKSPILVLKYGSPKISPKVRKKLFNMEKNCNKEPEVRERSNSIILDRNDAVKDIRKDESCSYLSNPDSDKNTSNQISVHTEYSKIYSNNSDLVYNSNIHRQEKTEDKDMSKTDESNLEDSFGKMPADLALVKKVQSYFDSHFSSETSQSQVSINSILTQKHDSKTSDDIEIISTITQIPSNRVSSQSEQEAISKNASSLSSGSAETSLTLKKIKHKKGGLAYRLNALLKKKNANISLWQHERFLAENSNFVIPKGEHIVCHIRKVHFKYGSYLLEGFDEENNKFLILISGNYVDNVTITTEMIFKLYEPYTIVDYKKDCKLIINACKFECINLNQ